MNSGNRHSKYKRSVYRRKRLKSLLIILICAIVALFIIFVLAGNSLKDKVEGPTESGTDTDIPVLSDDEHSTPKEIMSSFISLEADGTLTSKVQNVNRDGGKAFGVGMTDSEGILLYRSDLASKLGFDVDPDASLRLSDMSSVFSRFGLHSSALFRFDTLSVKDPLQRSVLLSYNAALAAEAYAGGFDDVLLTFSNMTAEDIPLITSLAENIRSINENAVIGIAIPPSLLVGEDSSEIAAALWESFDFLAADLTPLANGEDPIADIEETCSHMQYFLHRYKIRILLPSLEDAEKSEALLSAMDNYGVSNIQLIG